MEVPCIVVTPQMLEPLGMAAESASYTRMRPVARRAWEHVREAAGKKAGCLRSVEGMERERACGRREAGAGECSMRAGVKHETSRVCRTEAMVVSRGSQCQGRLDFVRLCRRVRCKPMALAALPSGIPSLSHTVTTTTHIPALTLGATVFRAHHHQWRHAQGQVIPPPPLWFWPTFAQFAQLPVQGVMCVTTFVSQRVV